MCSSRICCNVARMSFKKKPYLSTIGVNGSGGGGGGGARGYGVGGSGGGAYACSCLMKVPGARRRGRGM